MVLLKTQLLCLINFFNYIYIYIYIYNDSITNSFINGYNEGDHALGGYYTTVL